MSETIITEANDLFRSGNFSAALRLYREAQNIYPQLSSIFDLNIKLCEKNFERSVNNHVEIFITLTTISERLDKLLPVIESLHNQSLKPTRIFLNLSEEPYLLDKGVRKDDARLTALLRFPILDIKWVENTGPYRKILPFMADFYSEESVQDRIFITVDDDTIYPDYFVETLYKNHIESDSIVAFRGRYITQNNLSLNSYDEWKLGAKRLCINNLPTGKDGVIYNTKFFTKDFIDFHIAKELAPTADDLWIKWHTGLNGVKAIILNPEAATSDYKSFPVVDYSAAYRDVSLFKAHNSNNSGGKNDMSIQKLENYFTNKYGYNLFSLCSIEEATF